MPTSDRPEILIDEHGRRLIDPNQAEIGVAGPLGRERIVSCLPFGDGPRQLVTPAVLADAHGRYVADPEGNIVGRPGVWVSRMVQASTVHDTRRL